MTHRTDLLLLILLAFCLPLAGQRAAAPAPMTNPFHPDGRSDHPGIDLIIAEIAPMYGVDPRLSHAQIQVESDFHWQISATGAVGIAQIELSNNRRLLVSNSDDIFQEIRGECIYMRDVLAEFGGDPRLALAAYNAGERRVAACMCIPPIRETQQYVRAVMRHYEELKRTVSLRHFDPLAKPPGSPELQTWRLLMNGLPLAPSLVRNIPSQQIRNSLAVLLLARYGIDLPPGRASSQLALVPWYRPVRGRGLEALPLVQLRNYLLLRGALR